MNVHLLVNRGQLVTAIARLISHSNKCSGQANDRETNKIVIESWEEPKDVYQASRMRGRSLDPERDPPRLLAVQRDQIGPIESLQSAMPL